MVIAIDTQVSFLYVHHEIPRQMKIWMGFKKIDKNYIWMIPKSRIVI